MNTEYNEDADTERPMNTWELLTKHLGPPTRTMGVDGAVEVWTVCRGAYLECWADGIYFKGLYPKFGAKIPKRRILDNAKNPERSLVAFIAKLRHDVPKAIEIDEQCRMAKIRLEEVAGALSGATGYHVSTDSYDRITISIGIAQAKKLLKKFP